MNREPSLVNQPGRFAWYELLTTDVAAACAFYGKVVGWVTKDASTPELAYTVLTAGDAPVVGLMDLPEEGLRSGATPRWVGYVAVDDMDVRIEQIRRLGGAILVPPTDSNIGRLSVVADPQGDVCAGHSTDISPTATQRIGRARARGLARVAG